jgi:hypothetical protein
MTHNAETPSRKPRRRGLLAPFILLGVVAVAWSIGWLYLSGQAQKRMDTTAASLKARGYDLSWKTRTVTGYPFRMDVNLTEARIAEPSGWAVRAPELKGEAMVYALGHWVVLAPQGVVLTRPTGGDVRITGQALRASFAGFDKYPPRISVEGAKLSFLPAPGAAPFPLVSTESLQLHLRPGPDDQAGLLFKAEGARAAFTGLLGRIAQDRTASMQLDARLSKVSALRGTSWSDAARDWSAVGGTISVENGKLAAGEALLDAKSGALTIGDDGRLRGTLDVAVREVAPTAGALSSPQAAAAAVKQAVTGDPTLSATLVFENGRTRMGPFDSGPSPRVY